MTNIVFGDYGERILEGMRRTVATLWQSGCSVIVDDLLFKQSYLQDYLQVLEPTRTWFIGVRCNSDVVAAREAQRPGRFPGTALAHFEQIHQHGVRYDLEVDTSYNSPRDTAELIKERLSFPPIAFTQALQSQSRS